jgi:hypothetical protein
MRRLPLLLASLLVAVALRAADTPAKPPAGFHLQTLDTIKGRLLVPDGWFYSAEEANGTHAFFAAREKFDAHTQFKVGLTLNCIKGISTKTGLKPSAYCVAFAQHAASTHTLSEVTRESNGPLTILQFHFFDPTKDAPNATHIVDRLIANDSTDTLYACIIEAPAPEWDKFAPTGTTMLQSLALDPAY